MSSERGNAKKGAPAHQNSFAWKHNPKSKKTEKILAAPNEGLCNRCTEQIEWRKKYRKYKPLSSPSRCVECQERNIKRAYHVLCTECSRKLKVCAKCKNEGGIVRKIVTDEERAEEKRNADATLRAMSERERRTFFRKLESGKDDDESKASDDEDGEDGEDGEESTEEGEEEGEK